LHSAFFLYWFKKKVQTQQYSESIQQKKKRGGGLIYENLLLFACEDHPKIAGMVLTGHCRHNHRDEHPWNNNLPFFVSCFPSVATGCL
jgi:hypothetical protein